VLTLTPDAARAVVDVVLARQLGPDAGLRISPGPPSTAERTWNYAVEAKPWEGDVVVTDGPARVFVDADAAGELDDAVLDAHVDDDTLEVRFVVRTA
jgi:Fe-S cluster assembly iron-binding protein IscA